MIKLWRYYEIMKIGIVILNYHSKELTENLAKSLSLYPIVTDIVIVDNASGEDFSKLAANDEKITFISNDKNDGYARGNNIGLRYLYQEKKCEFAFIANPDVVVPQETIEKIVEFLNVNNQYAIASSKRYSNTGVKMGQYWNIPTYRECLLDSFYVYRKRLATNYAINTTKLLFEGGLKDEYLTVEVVPGAFFGMNLATVANVGFLDEETFLYYEENILAVKLKNHNYKSAILVNCTYEHNHKAGNARNTNYKFYLSAKLYYAKQYLKCKKFKMFLLRLGNLWCTLEKKIQALLKK